MAKEQKQDDLFPVDPMITGLGITSFKLKGGNVQGILDGVTNTFDIALLDAPCWKKAIASWLVELHNGDVDEAMVSLKKAYIDWANNHGEPVRETPASGSNVSKFKN